MARTKQTARKPMNGTRKPPHRYRGYNEGAGGVPAVPHAFTIAHQNQFEMLQDMTPFDGSASEHTESDEGDDDDDDDTPPPAGQQSSKTKMFEAGNGSKLNDRQEARARRQQIQNTISVKGPFHRDYDEPLPSDTDTDTDDKDEEEEEDITASTTRLAGTSKAGKLTKNENMNNQSEGRRVLNSRDRPHLLPQGPSGLTYSQAIPVHGTQDPRSHLGNAAQAPDAAMSDDPDLSQERLKRSRPASDEDDEDDGNEGDSEKERAADQARPRKPTVRSNSVPPVQVVIQTGRNHTLPRSNKSTEVLKTLKREIDQKKKADLEDAANKETAAEKTKEKEQEELVETSDKAATTTVAGTTTTTTVDIVPPTAKNDEEKKEEDETASPFLNFETLPGSPIQPFDGEGLMTEYEATADDYDIRMQAVMQEYKDWNDRVENWVMRGTKVLEGKEACRLNTRVLQVTEKVEEATKQREELVNFCRHMQKAFSMFFQDSM